MMYSKRHYIQLAKLLAKHNNTTSLTEELIPILQNDNPNFNEKRFREAIQKEKNQQ